MKNWKLLPLLVVCLSTLVQAAPSPATYLKQVMVGNQAGLLKVLTPQRKIAYTRGIDDRSLARMGESERAKLFLAMGLGPSDLSVSAENLMRDYSKLPRKEAVAVLGTLGSSPILSPTSQDKIEKFMVRVMQSDKDVAARRQAILALAVMPDQGAQVTEKLVQHFETTANLWETFPIQQYFEYHAAEVRQYPQYPQLRQRISQVQSLYTEAILGYLDSATP